MTSFNVLARHQDVQRSAFVEASAGTGKTFAIENIVVRLLVESSLNDEPLPIEKILVVTFTRAATRDLRERLRANIERVLHFCRCFLNDTPLSEACPDYLCAFIEQGVDAVKKVSKLLERALLNFDQAQVFTIHGFCGRILNTYAIDCGLSFQATLQENAPLMPIKIRQAVRDFLRTELTPQAFSAGQLNLLLKHFKRKFNKLEDKLLELVQKGLPIAKPPSLEENLAAFQAAMQVLKNQHKWHSQAVLEDFLTHAPLYNKVTNKAKNIHPEILQKAQRFADLFDKNVWDVDDFDLLLQDGLCFVDLFDASHLKSKKSPPSALPYPTLIHTLKTTLGPVISRARHISTILAAVSADCQTFIQRYQSEEELLGHNDILSYTQRAVKQSEFVKKVRQAYAAVIVDEFQDTDPIQWEIFATLFTESDWKGYLYLVGDPKQSIYSFRQADIYTYLAAAKKLGPEAYFTLDSNFRSQPQLLSILNALFLSAKNPFSLPRTQASLPYKPVLAGRSVEAFPINHHPCLQFWALRAQGNTKIHLKELEAQMLFPAIATELLRLKSEENFAFKKAAILVANRFQADELAAYLETCAIPVRRQRASNLAYSSALKAMYELLEGIYRFKHRGTLKKALGCKVIGMQHNYLARLESHVVVFEKILWQCDALRKIWLTEGFGVFYNALMTSVWKEDGKNVLEHILGQSDGQNFFREWQDIADVLIAEQGHQNLSPEDLFNFIDNFESLAKCDDGRVKGYVDLEQDGVFILTTHISKGLEFDIVFTPGLMYSHTLDSEGLIPIMQNSEQVLGMAYGEEDANFIQHCEEIDAEKMRQLYVAVTRAKYRLYIPLVLSNKPSEIPLGAASPMALLLGRLEQPVKSYLELYSAMAKESCESFLVQFIEKHTPHASLVYLDRSDDECSLPAYKDDASQIGQLLEPKKIEIAYEPLWIQSFTSLAHKQEEQEMPMHEGMVAPYDFQIIDKTAHNLPAGAKCGNVLHKILECLPFHLVKNCDKAQDLLPLIRPFIKDKDFLAWEDVLAQIVFSALTTKLAQNDFCLADIHPKQIFRETEFLYACAKHDLGNIALQPGYVKGVMDVFFEYRGKYYLLDWKSNWLGPSIEYYRPEHLNVAMQMNRYDMQVSIYTEALKRYLKIFDDRPFEELFGGVYYFFLRGVTANTGIWFL